MKDIIKYKRLLKYVRKLGYVISSSSSNWDFKEGINLINFSIKGK